MGKKSFTVVARNDKIRRQGLKTDKGEKSFNGSSALQVYDEGEAKELKARYKHDINIVQDDRHEWHMKHDNQTDGHNVDIHHYTFSGVDMTKKGGNERVKVKTADGYTFMSLEQAEELELEIIAPQKREKRRKGAEVTNGRNSGKGSL